MNVWVVGQFVNMSEEDGMAWEFQGVFSTEKKAVDACTEPHWFVAPAKLDEVLPSEKVPWPGFYYPAEKDDTEVSDG